MNDFEYNSALPSFAKYAEWYRTCRKYDIPRDELLIATKLLDKEEYDPKSALLLMSTYNEDVERKIEIDIDEERRDDFDTSAKYGVLGTIIGFIIGVIMTWLIFMVTAH